ncbi:Killer toxin subunits alpha/beta [Colletotrichum tanaceti]|uniref:chitinase n=1 Tax=Colletotrichum tanaceti TaxID=1306861 RepID=A0A4U6X1Q5_9PEZI|nr:Killer toxin subunits alpha/beta [Colletotrichum tanaceti]TKW49075.1 Killer toxin subunits alpha/beta [Colletotrichum tanaceti]
MVRVGQRCFLPLVGSLFHRGGMSQQDLCPTTCVVSGPDPANWTTVGEFGQLQACKKPLVLDFSVTIPVTEKQPIRACNVFANDFYAGPVEPPASGGTEDVASIMAWTPAGSENETGGLVASQPVEHLQSYLRNAMSRAANRTILFATASDVTVGVYVGANLLNPSVAETLFDYLLAVLFGPGIADEKSALIQACDGRSGDQIFGLIAASTPDFTTVHNAVARWSNGQCVDISSYPEVFDVDPEPIDMVSPNIALTLSSGARVGLSKSTDSKNVTSPAVRGLLLARADCRTIDVKSGDDCGELVTRCGGGMTAADLYKYNPKSNLCSTLQPGQLICCSAGTLPKPTTPQPNPDGSCRTQRVHDGDDCGKLVTRCGDGLTAAQFYQYNTKSGLCATLQPGQHVCCTPGKLPDLRPKKNADGSCFAYKIQDGDFCAKVAAAHGLTVDELEKLNKETWGWNGCENGFWPDNWICLSEGTPPFPAPIANAVCGPQKPGSTKPSGSTSRDWAKMNQCPLNSCCNIWGQCGTTEDFCIDTNTGPPGTAKKNTYGCISNCGMSIIQSGPPAQFIKLGYFEGFNLGRNCLNMDATQIDPSFTHVHFAFGMIDDNFNVYQEDELAEFQFQQFKKLRGPKRIISFGGWVFSAEVPFYHIFRNGVKPENREKLADNLVKYVVDNGLDGLDIDWEYPSAPNLGEGVPEGDPSEALNYLRLLSRLRAKLPKDKSLSIAAPASHWYLKQFPIKAMSELLDYIVYMTYDLHGQWDAGNKWATPGCPTGNCLRSHVNRTETMNTLVMITKAGVPSNKVLVGVSSYGRSFQMANPSCTGPNCLYTGDRLTSYARKGRCTDTAGYMSNAEIAEIKGRSWLDAESNSRIMVDGDLWVAYMDDNLKESRTQAYKRYNMGGTIDWAVDLVKFHDPPKLLPDGINLGLSWASIKANVRMGESATCNPATRTGTWVDKQCSHAAVTDNIRMTPKARWDALDCKNGWEDIIRRWQGCDFREGTGEDFSEHIASYLHMPSRPRCNDLGQATTCTTELCDAHNTPETLPKDKTGACAYELWNGLAEIHTILRNYYDSLQNTGNSLARRKDNFVETFAPKPDDDSKIFDLFLTLMPIPLTAAVPRFFGSALASMKYFSGATGNDRRAAWEAGTITMIGTAFSVAKDALDSASSAREEIALNDIFDRIITNWRAQVNQLVARIFNGSPESIKLLNTLVSDGKMIQGKEDRPADGYNSNYTTSWEDSKYIERAFFTLAIPALWAANRPTPFILDFGDSCVIDATKYFEERADKYNAGWRCPNGHSYILAGVDDVPQGCPHSNPRLCLLPRNRNFFKILKGIDELEEPGQDRWGKVTVDDLIIGAVNTYKKNNGRNVMDPAKSMTDPADIRRLQNVASQDTRLGGFQHIPICGPEEARANLLKGRKAYGNSPNYPCNP